MSRNLFVAAFAVGLAVMAWVGLGFVGSSAIALAMTAVIAGVYLLGAFEVRQFRAATSALAEALARSESTAPGRLTEWLAALPPALQNPVRQRIEGARSALPGLALTPYLVGLLVMLGMLGTFLGLGVTFKGAVFALEGSTDLQAIRAALAAPIQGLGLSFGTSVAGVAASAMLGLMSALARRERLDASRRLDAQVATVFKPFSLKHQRQEALLALQDQSRVWPEVAGQLQAWMAQMEQRAQQLDTQLLLRQEQFHREAAQAYTGLAQSVAQSLQDSLSASARLAGESLRPVVEAAMAEIARESRQLQAQVSATTQQQLGGVAEQLGQVTQRAAEGWQQALQTQEARGHALLDGLERTLAAFTLAFEQRSEVLQSRLSTAFGQTLAELAATDRVRQDAWAASLAAMVEQQQVAGLQASAQAQAQQQGICTALAQVAQEITERTGQQAERSLGDVGRLLAQAEAQVVARAESDRLWQAQQHEQMERMGQQWRAEMAAFREAEALRGDAAVARLGALQAALAEHLAVLGAALETPLERLLQVAAEGPRAAAEVLAQLREEAGRLADQNHLALAEREQLLARLGALLQAMEQAVTEQRQSIEALAGSAGVVLAEAGQRFSEVLGAQSSQATEVAVQVAGSAAELASLGASFGQGVEGFGQASGQLIDGLARIEAALAQSMARSDEQLAYYVAQAREVIDLSIAAQQGIVDDLRRLREPEAASVAGAAG